MAKIILWNSIAKRRRSISDTFYDNGLGTLKGYLAEKGHTVEIEDCARDDVFQQLSWLPLAGLIRRLYARLIRTQSRLVRLLLGPLAMKLQDLLSRIQDRRLKAALRRLAERVRDSGARVFGVKMWYGEAFKNANWLIDEIHRIAPDVITIAGGYHVTLYEEKLMARSRVDLGVVCEGEYPLEKILAVVDKYEGRWGKGRVLNAIRRLARENKIENLMVRENGDIFKSRRHQVEGCSSKSVPSYDINDNKVAVHVMVESLGCSWGQCHFCVHQHFYPKYSMRAVEEIVEEIKAMQKQGIGVFRFAGSDTLPAFGARIAQKILDEGLTVIFGMGSRAVRNARGRYDALVESYETLIRGGLRAVFMGGETGNDRINHEVMNKGVNSDDLIYTAKALREAERRVRACPSKLGERSRACPSKLGERSRERVYLSLGMIYPMPLLGKVTLDTVKENNLSLLEVMRPDSVLITPPGPFLHTDWYKERKKFGFELDDDLIRQAIEYEYVLYKPPEFWPRLGVSLEGRPFKALLAECNDFRKEVEQELKIPTDISDEHFLMFYAAGIRTEQEILDAKHETLLDIVSSDYRYTQKLTQRINAFSRDLCGWREGVETQPAPRHLPASDQLALSEA